MFNYMFTYYKEKEPGVSMKRPFCFFSLFTKTFPAFFHCVSFLLAYNQVIDQLGKFTGLDFC